MPLDPTIPLQAKVPDQINPLTTLGQFSGIQNAMNQNKLFSQQMQDRQTIGQAYQGATDPTTGQVDYNKLTGSLAASGGGALVPGAIQSAQEQQGRALTITGTQQTQAKAANDYINAGASSMLQIPGGPTKEHVAAYIANGVQNGIIPKAQGYAEIAALPDDPAAIAQGLQQHLLQSMTPEARAGQLYGTPQIVNQGGQQVPVAISPMNGVRQIGAPIANTISPETAAQQVPHFDPKTNAPGTVPLSNLVTPTGQAVPSTPAAGYTGRFPAVAATGGPSASAPGFNQTGPALGSSAGADVQGTESAKQGVTLQQQNETYPDTKAALGNMDALAKDFTSGPGAGDWNKFKAGINAATQNLTGMSPFSTQPIAAMDDFNKVSAQFVQKQLANLGAGTDAKLDAAGHSNPTTAMSSLGLHGAINMMKGLADATNVKANAYQSFLANGGTPDKYNAFSTDFNKSFDPRVFQSAYMAPADVVKMTSGMTAPELKQFIPKYNLAVAKGWIPNPLEQGGAANGGQ